MAGALIHDPIQDLLMVPCLLNLNTPGAIISDT